MQMAEKLGSETPIIVTTASGIIGRDACTGEFKEVRLCFFLICSTICGKEKPNNYFTSFIFFLTKI